METGILEEPDLTLVSLNTTQCSVLPDSQQDHIEPNTDGNNVSGFISSNMAEMKLACEGKENIQPSGKYIHINIISGCAIIYTPVHPIKLIRNYNHRRWNDFQSEGAKFWKSKMARKRRPSSRLRDAGECLRGMCPPSEVGAFLKM